MNVKTKLPAAAPGNKRKGSGMERGDRPVRVLRVIARMNIGGPALHVSLLSAGLNQNGYEHLLVAGSESEREGSLVNLASELGVMSRSLPALGREISPFRDPVCLQQLRCIVREFRPDILHTHTAKAGCLGRFAGLLERVPVLAHTFHGHVLTGYFSPLKQALFRQLEAWLAARTQLLITVSEAPRKFKKAARTVPRDYSGGCRGPVGCGQEPETSGPSGGPDRAGPSGSASGADRRR